jgi:hypothetical protein
LLELGDESKAERGGRADDENDSFLKQHLDAVEALLDGGLEDAVVEAYAPASITRAGAAASIEMARLPPARADLKDMARWSSSRPRACRRRNSGTSSASVAYAGAPGGGHRMTS